MAAPEGVAHSSAFRTTWPPTRCALQPLPPGHRKFPFETQAADPGSIAAVAVERLLNQSDKDCGQELLATGFGSPGAGAWADAEGGRDRLGMEEFNYLDSSLEQGQVGSRSPGLFTCWRSEVGAGWRENGPP